jgi:peptidoglycan/LPS O-acetylase OafA/YrhL
VRALFLDAASPVRAHFFASVPYYATFTSTWFVDTSVAHPILFAYAWSLAVEEQFYAVWPHVARRGPAFAAACAVAFLGVDLAGGRVLSGLPLAIVSSLRPPLVLGALAACVLHTERGFAWAYRLVGSRAAAPVVLALVGFSLATGHVSLLATQALLVLLVVACVVREDSGLSGFLRWQPVRHVGEVSYGIYMLHLAAIFVAKRVVSSEVASGAAVFAIALPISVALATVSHKYFESRFVARP